MDFLSDPSHRVLTNVTSNETKYLNPTNLIGNGKDTFNAKGTWDNLIKTSENGKTFTVSGFENFKVDLVNKFEHDEAVNIFQASEGSTLKFADIGNLELHAGGAEVKETGKNNPIPVHAYGGHIDMAVNGNVTMTSDNSNAIYSQATNTPNGKEASVTINASGDVSLTSHASTIGAVVYQANVKSSSVSITGNNVSLTSTGDGYDAIDLVDEYNEMQHSGELSVSINASNNLTMRSKRVGIYQSRSVTTGVNTTKSEFKAGGTIDIQADASAVFSRNVQGSKTFMTFDAPVINLQSNGNPAGANGPLLATLRANPNANIAFKSSNGSTNVTITADKGYATEIRNNGEISVENGTINIAKGDIDSQNDGTLKLTNSTLDLAGGVKGTLGIVAGENLKVTF